MTRLEGRQKPVCEITPSLCGHLGCPSPEEGGGVLGSNVARAWEPEERVADQVEEG